MDFGSGFVYHSDSDGDDDHDHGEIIDEQQLSASMFDTLRSPAPFAQENSRSSSRGGLLPTRGLRRNSQQRNQQKTHRQRVDVNVVGVDLTALGQPSNFVTGEPIVCENCGVFFSHLSQMTVPVDRKATDQNSGEIACSSSSFQQVTIWNCEFCMHSNVIEVPEETPDASLTTLDYIIAPPPAIDEDLSNRPKEVGIVIPVVDTSGSMCLTSEVDGTVHIRGDAASRLADLRIGGEDADQHLPNEKRGISYVSRLQCVQGAVSSLIDDLKEKKPETHVGLVTFSDAVRIHGDATGQPFVVSGSALDSFEQMKEIGKCNKVISPESETISKTSPKLTDRLFSLEEGGPTSLGPAVVAAISQAAEFNKTADTTNAKVVLATDGLANVGVGSLENESDGDENEVVTAMKTDEFYRMVGTWASACGVTVDVFGIEGDNCDIENLGTLAELSNGSVNLVNPINLLTDFGHMMTSQKVATDVSLKVYIHLGVEFRGEDPDNVTENDNHSHLTKHIGIVTADSGPATFEFNVKSSRQLQKLNFGHLKSLPFQVHISYTSMDGTRCLRVISDQRSVTRIRDEAEKNADVNLLSGHVQSRCAEYARKGHYTKSRVSARAWGNVFNRAMAHQASASPQIREEMEMKLQELNDVDGLIGDTVQTEMASGDYMSSDDEADEAVKTKQKYRRKKHRSKNDALSSKLYSLSKSAR